MYDNVDNLPWNEAVPNNTFGIDEVSNGYSNGISRDPQVYRFTGDPDNLLSGKGILTMQKFLAYVFRYTRFDTVYKKYYIDDAETRTALCSGYYGPVTMELVMIFQSYYMVDIFRNDWNPATGFGMFGKNTYETLMDLHRKVVIEQRQIFLRDKSNAYKW